MKGVYYSKTSGGTGIWYGILGEGDTAVQTAWDTLPSFFVMPVLGGNTNPVYQATLYQAANAADLQSGAGRTTLDTFLVPQASGNQVHVLIAPKINLRTLVQPRPV